MPQTPPMNLRLPETAMGWRWPKLGKRPNRDSRGIQNLRNTCYQLSVLQALLHQPLFVRWIMTHNTGSDSCTVNSSTCVTCCMQQLAEEYWGKVDPTDNPILSAENSPSWLAQASYHSGMFERGEQEDARLFLSWIIDQFSQNVPATRTNAWQAQHQALFQVVLQPFDKCTICGHVKHRPKEVETMLNVGVFDTHKTIYEALQDTLIGKVDGAWCDNCRKTQAMYRTSDIAAAPEILSIALQIMLPGGKARHALKYPEILDLTVCQADSTRPLYYRLNAVVSHLGEDDAGHYIASVRSREPGRFTAISDNELISPTT